MDTRKIIKNISILRAFQGEVSSISDAVASCSESRSTVYRFLSHAEDWKLVVHSADGYVLTAAGDLILREYDCFEEKERDDISFLAELKYSPILLRILENSPPMRKAEMVRESGASRSAVQQNIEKLHDDHEWINKRNGSYELNTAGEEALESYEEFEKKIGVIDDKIEFLERYEGNTREIPIEALAESRMVVSTVTDRQKVVREVSKLDPGDAEPLRAISHAFSTKISDRYWSKLSPETECEMVVDREVYKAISHPKGWKYLFKGLRHPNFRIMVYPDNLTVGVFHFGDEQAGISAYNEENPLHVGLYGENDALIKWAKSVYEKHREQATSPPRDLFKWAIAD